MTVGSLEGLQTVSVRGTELAYREQGEGDPVVFVHGTARDVRSWDGQLDAVGAQYRAIAYSRRYARPNADIEPGADDQMLPHVEDLAALLAALDAAPAHLVGHSWGGFVCLLTAIRHPELVRSLVLGEPPVMSLFISTPPRPGELVRLLARRPRTGVALLKIGATTIRPAEKAFRNDEDERGMEIFASGVFGKEKFAGYSEEFKQISRENLSSMKAQLLGAGMPPLSADEVRSVQAPTLLLSGEQSPAAFQRLVDYLHELLPNSERAEIAGVSHALHQEDSAAFNEALLAFLARR